MLSETYLAKDFLKFHMELKKIFGLKCLVKWALDVAVISNLLSCFSISV